MLIVLVSQSKKTDKFCDQKIHKLKLQPESKHNHWPEPNSTKFHENTKIHVKVENFAAKHKILQTAIHAFSNILQLFTILS